jgi:prophage regulatory protein
MGDPATNESNSPNQQGEIHMAIWRMKRVAQEVGAAPSTIYRWVQAGIFPAPVKIGPRASGWHSEAVVDWEATRPLA